MGRFSFPARLLPQMVMAVLLAIALLTGARTERLGDRAQIALPLLGLACAAVTGGAGDYALRYGVMWLGIRAGKNGLGQMPVNMRPNGGDGGMPSGHMSSASFGASALVSGCLASSPPGRITAIIAAGFTGSSRIVVGAHTIWQVLAGVLWALFCERGLRSGGFARTAGSRAWRALSRAVGLRRNAAAAAQHPRPLPVAVKHHNG